MADKSDRSPARRGKPPKGWPEEFLRWLSACPNVSRACRAAKVNRDTAYSHRNRYPSFAARWDAALQQGITAAEDEAWRRAQHGTVKPVFGEKGIKGHVREFDNNLLIKMLAAHRPEVYREKFDVNLLLGQATERIEEAAREAGMEESQIDMMLELIGRKIER